MKFSKKLLMGTGALMGTITPIAAVISCGEGNPQKTAITSDEFGNSDNTERTLPEKYKIPAGITKIEDYAFSNITNVPENFAIPNSVTEIGSWAFEYTILPKGFYLPNNPKLTLGRQVFYRSTLAKDFEWPSKVEEVPEECFEETKFDANGNPLNLFNVTKVGEAAFKNVVFTQPIIWGSKVDVLSGAFKHASLPLGFKTPGSGNFAEGAFSTAILPKDACWGYQDELGIHREREGVLTSRPSFHNAPVQPGDMVIEISQIGKS